MDFYGVWHPATLSPNGKRIVGTVEYPSGGGCIVQIWDATNGVSVATISTSAAVYSHVVFTPDGAALVLGGGGPPFLADSRPPTNPAEALIVLDPATAHTKQRLIPLGGKFDNVRQVEAVAVSPDGRQVAAAERDHTVWVYNLATGQIRHRFAGHSGAISSLAFTADGRRLISASSDLTALVWDVGLARSGGIAKPEAKDFDRLWADLSRPDWPTASSAMAALVAHPDAGIATLHDRLHPATPTGDSQTIDGMVAKLDSPKFAEREQASRDLTALGSAIRDDLSRRAETAKSAEVRQRLQKIVADLGLQGTLIAQLGPDEIRQIRAVEVLEQIATPAAREQLRILAGGANTARLSIEAAAALQGLDK
jgi:WD domain, G-beta repeat